MQQNDTLVHAGNFVPGIHGSRPVKGFDGLPGLAQGDLRDRKVHQAVGIAGPAAYEVLKQGVGLGVRALFQVDRGEMEKGVSMFKGKSTSNNDRVVGVQWKNSSIVETWASPPLPRDIIDFGFTRQKGRDVMVILTRNNEGKYALEIVK